MTRAVVIHPGDNVATLIDTAAAGDQCQLQGAADGRLSIVGDVPYGHKVAIRDLHAGEAVVKYNKPIGRLTSDVAAGAHVHVHNVGSSRSGELSQAGSGLVQEGK